VGIRVDDSRQKREQLTTDPPTIDQLPDYPITQLRDYLITRLPD
jgi:hypothetical protein